MWAGVQDKNNSNEQNEEKKKANGQRNGTFLQIESRYARSRKDWGGEWAFAGFPYKREEGGIPQEPPGVDAQRSTRRHDKIPEMRKDSPTCREPKKAPDK